MNFQGKAILVYLEEDNIARAYFRVQPLMTQDGPLGPMAAEFPDDGFLRIVPDKNEQHTFKERMRTLGNLCLVDLRFFPADSNKIRTNKNYSPSRGESNQFIVYSDAVRALPDDLLYQVVAEGEVSSASTPFVYIRKGANIQGPFRRDTAQPVGEPVQLPPDSSEIHAVTVSGQEKLFFWPRAQAAEKPADAAEAPANMDAPAAAKPPVKAEMPAPAKPIVKAEAPAPEKAPAKAAIPAPEKAEAPAPAAVEAPAAPVPAKPAREDAPAPVKADAPAPAPEEKNAYDQIQSMNAPLSEHANRLHESAAQPAPFMAEQPSKPLVGTKLYQAPQRPANPRRAHNPLMEAVENQRYAARIDGRLESRYEAPGATLPQNAELREVANPIDALKRALQSMSHSPETQRQAADVLLGQNGLRAVLSKALARENNSLTLAAMQTQLQDLEAERLMTLMQLDDAKKNLAAAHEEALGKLNMAEQKKLDQLHIAQQNAQNALDEAAKALEPIERKRQAAAQAIEEMKNALDQRLICSPVGRDASREELLERVEKTLRAAGFLMEEGDALTLLTAYALTLDSLEICSDTEADAQMALAAFARALGAPLVESEWDEKLVMLPGGSAPVLVQYNGARHPLICSVKIHSVFQWEPEEEWAFPYASVRIPVDQDALPAEAPVFDGPVSKECVMRAFFSEASLSNEAKAAVFALRKGLLNAGAPLPVPAVDMLCRFVSATQNELKGGVAEALDRAVCLYVLPHLRDKGVDVASVKDLFVAMPRATRYLNA